MCVPVLQTAVSCMLTEEIHDKYCAKAANLENDGSLRDAERFVDSFTTYSHTSLAFS